MTRRRTSSETRAINRVLAANGLGKVDSADTIRALAYRVADHNHFRELLNKCEPAERSDMYAAMRPHLRFTAKPLDVYIAEMGQLAEAKQLPTVTKDGTLAPYRVSEIDSTKKFGDYHLELRCYDCRTLETFSAPTAEGTAQLAEAAGWTKHAFVLAPLCPKCAPPPEPVTETKTAALVN